VGDELGLWGAGPIGSGRLALAICALAVVEVVLLSDMELEALGAVFPVAVQLSLMAYAARVGGLPICGVLGYVSIPLGECAMVFTTEGLSIEGWLVTVQAFAGGFVFFH
jgi:hypothetical protein